MAKRIERVEVGAKEELRCTKSGTNFHPKSTDLKP
jgi:hypothetical protein